MVKMEKRKSFVFFVDWHRVLARYSAALRCAVYDAIIGYAATGEEPKLDGEARMAFDFIREDIDRNNRKYEATCARRKKAIEKRWAKESAAKNTNEYNSNNSIQMIQADTTHTENENENENENDILYNENNINNIPPHPARARAREPREQEKDFFSILMMDDDFLSNTATALGTTSNKVLEMLEKFEKEGRAKNKIHDSIDDLRRHFIDWSRLELRNSTKTTKTSKTSRNNGKNKETGGSGQGSDRRSGARDAAAQPGTAAYSYGLVDD